MDDDEGRMPRLADADLALALEVLTEGFARVERDGTWDGEQPADEETYRVAAEALARCRTAALTRQCLADDGLANRLFTLQRDYLETREAVLLLLRQGHRPDDDVRVVQGGRLLAAQQLSAQAIAAFVARGSMERTRLLLAVGQQEGRKTLEMMTEFAVGTDRLVGMAQVYQLPTGGGVIVEMALPDQNEGREYVSAYAVPRPTVAHVVAMVSGG